MSKIQLRNGSTIELLLDGKTVMMVYAEDSGVMGRSDHRLLAVIVGNDVTDCKQKYLRSKGVETDDYETAFKQDMSEWRFHSVFTENA